VQKELIIQNARAGKFPNGRAEDRRRKVLSKLSKINENKGVGNELNSHPSEKLPKKKGRTQNEFMT